MKTIRVNTMQWGILFIAALLLLPIGCDGPAEEAGEELDERVEQIRQESSQLQQQISDYKKQIEQSREDLETTRTELASAETELAELRRQRDQIIAEMENMQLEGQEENVGPATEAEDVQPGGQ